MFEPLLERIQALEKANRRWKVISGVLAAALLGVLLSGGVFWGVFGRRALVEREQAMDMMEQARMQEAVARQQVELARQRAVQALDEAEQAKKK